MDQIRKLGSNNIIISSVKAVQTACDGHEPAS